MFLFSVPRAREGVQGEHEMAESKGRPGTYMGSVRRPVADGTRQATVQTMRLAHGSHNKGAGPMG
jgi:hypothetical protein